MAFVSAFVSTGAWPFDCNKDLIVTHNRCIPDLHVPVKYHTAGSPVFSSVWPDIIIHKGRNGLACEKSSHFSISVANTHGRLSFVCSYTEQVKLEVGFQFSGRCRRIAFYTKSCLP